MDFELRKTQDFLSFLFMYLEFLLQKNLVVMAFVLPYLYFEWQISEYIDFVSKDTFLERLN